MGWTFGLASRDEVIEEVTRSWQDQNSGDYRCIAHTNGLRHIWMLWTRSMGGEVVETFIMLALIQREVRRDRETRRGVGIEADYGYKLIDEAMGPQEYDCPLTYLDQTTTPDYGYGAAWREKVRARAEKRAAISRERVRRAVFGTSSPEQDDAAHRPAHMNPHIDRWEDL